MRNVPAGLLIHYQQQVQTTAFCVLITLARRQPRVVHISNSNPGIVTCMWPHGWQDGTVCKFVDIEGMTEINFVPVDDEKYFQATVLSPTTFSINQDTTTWTPYKLGTTYGTARRVLGFTDHEKNLVVENVVLQAATGAQESVVSTSGDLSFSKREVESVLTSEQIRPADVAKGIYSGAEVETFEVDYTNLGSGRHVLEYGRIGDVTWGDVRFIAEVHGLLAMLSQQQGPLISVTCRAQLGTRIKAPVFPNAPQDERFGCKVRLNPDQWLPSTAYTPVQNFDAALGSIVKASVYDGRRYECTKEGVSSSVEPVWNTAIGAVTADGTVEWTTKDAFTKRGVITGVVDRRTFSDFERTEPTGWFSMGLFTLLNGLDFGFSNEVRTYSRTQYAIIAVDAPNKFFYVSGDKVAMFPATDVIQVVEHSNADVNGDYTVVAATYEAGPNRTKVQVVEAIESAAVSGKIEGRPGNFILQDKAYRDLEVGNTYEAEVGCDGRKDTCKSTFNNIHNFRGEPHLPGFHKQFLYPDAPG